METINFVDRPADLSRENFIEGGTFQAQKSYYNSEWIYEKYHVFEGVVEAVVNHDEVVEDSDLWYVRPCGNYVFRIHRPDSLNINIYMFKRK